MKSERARERERERERDCAWLDDDDDDDDDDSGWNEVVTHLSNDQAHRCLTSVISRESMLSYHQFLDYIVPIDRVKFIPN